jgi:hypothetical protein
MCVQPVWVFTVFLSCGEGVLLSGVKLMQYLKYGVVCVDMSILHM